MSLNNFSRIEILGIAYVPAVFCNNYFCTDDAKLNATEIVLQLF